MNKVYVKLKDVGTSFYDAGQTNGVVGSKIGELELTGKVSKAINTGVLIKIEDQAQAAKDFQKQEEEFEAAVKAAQPTTVTVQVPATGVQEEKTTAKSKAAKAKADEAEGGTGGSGDGDNGGTEDEAAKKAAADSKPKLDI